MLAGPGAASLEVRGSRFAAHAAALADEGAELRAWLGGIRDRHRDARHVVFAWRGVGGRSRGSDGGEPHGTGARPCLLALQRAGLEGAAVAVARVFGGTQLGAANLARAYGAAAEAALAAAGSREMRAGRSFDVTVPYADAPAAERVLRGLGAERLRRAVADAGLQLRGWLPEPSAAALARVLAESTAGRARVEVSTDGQWA